MKNCMFQYATNREILVNTDLIDLDYANELFEKNRQDYIDRLENGEEPEMCIWVNCETKHSYGEALKHWCADDFLLVGGVLYQRV